MKSWKRILCGSGALLMGAMLAMPVRAQEEPVVDEAPAAFSHLPPAGISMGLRYWEGVGVEGIGDVLLPVYSPRQGLLFLNPRFSIMEDAEEINIGLGYRHLFLSPRIIVGGNVFADARTTPANNWFYQAGFGLEVLSDWVDARFNYYLPDDDIKEVETTVTGEPFEVRSRQTEWAAPYGQGRAAYQDGTLVSRTYMVTPYSRYLGYEQPLEGFDFEVGARLPIPGLQDWADLKVFAGYYSFDNDLTDRIDGFKGRVEVRALPALFLDFEYFEDEELNGSRFYAGTRLRVPFDLAAFAAKGNPFSGTLAGFKPTRRTAETPLDARMTDMVMRDPRVQVFQSAMTPAESWTVSELLALRRSRFTETLHDALVYVDRDNTSGVEDGSWENPYSTINKAMNNLNGMNAVYVLDAAKPYKEKVFIENDGFEFIGSGTGLPAYGGYRFATGRYPVLKSTMPNTTQSAKQLPFASTVNVMADDVWISGFEFRGLMDEILADLLRQPTLAKQPDLGDLLELLEMGVNLSGIFALDADRLMVTGNRFVENAAGVINVYSVAPPRVSKKDELAWTPKSMYVVDNHFEGNGLGVLSVGIGTLGLDAPKNLVLPPPSDPSTVVVAGNTFKDNLIGAAIGQMGGGLNVELVNNSFDTAWPAGIGAVIGNMQGDLNAFLVDNTVMGNHTLGLGVIHELGNANILIENNYIQDCQLVGVGVLANALNFGFKRPEFRGNVAITMRGNVITGTGRDIEIPEWLLPVGKPEEDDTFELPRVPAVLIGATGRNVSLTVEGDRYEGNEGGALLALLAGEKSVSASVSGVNGQDNGLLFGGDDDLFEMELLTGTFPQITNPNGYSFLVIGQSYGSAFGELLDSSFLNSGDLGVFVQPWNEAD